jgi:hypothetical protein
LSDGTATSAWRETTGGSTPWYNGDMQSSSMLPRTPAVVLLARLWIGAVAAVIGCGAGHVAVAPPASGPEPSEVRRGNPPVDAAVPRAQIEEYLRTVEYPGGLGDQYDLDAVMVDLDGDGTQEIVATYVSTASPEGYLFRRVGDGIALAHRGSELHVVRLPGSSEGLGLVDEYTCCGYLSTSVWVLRPGEAEAREVYSRAWGPADGAGTDCGEGDDSVYAEDVVELLLIDAQRNPVPRWMDGRPGSLRLEAIRWETGCPGERQSTTYRLEDLLREVQ